SSGKVIAPSSNEIRYRAISRLLPPSPAPAAHPATDTCAVETDRPPRTHRPDPSLTSSGVCWPWHPCPTCWSLLPPGGSPAFGWSRREPIPELSVTAEEVSASKPDPEGFLAAAAALGIPATPDNAPLRPGTGTAVQPGAQRASITLARPSLPAASASTPIATKVIGA